MSPPHRPFQRRCSSKNTYVNNTRVHHTQSSTMQKPHNSTLAHGFTEPPSPPLSPNAPQTHTRAAYRERSDLEQLLQHSPEENRRCLFAFFTRWSRARVAWEPEFEAPTGKWCTTRRAESLGREVEDVLEHPTWGELAGLWWEILLDWGFVYYEIGGWV